MPEKVRGRGRVCDRFKRHKQGKVGLESQGSYTLNKFGMNNSLVNPVVPPSPQRISRVSWKLIPDTKEIVPLKKHTIVMAKTVASQATADLSTAESKDTGNERTLGSTEMTEEA
jgi:hypothetical protein